MEGTCTGKKNGPLHLNIRIKEDEDPHNSIMKLLRILRPQWRIEDIKKKVFTEGTTNQLTACYTGCLRSSDDVVLVRVYGNMTDLYLDRRKEIEILHILHEHSCGPKLYCSFENGICYEFLQGIALDNKLLREPLVYRLIAEEMAKIHTIKPRDGSRPQAFLWTKMAHFLQLVQDSENDEMPSSLRLPETTSVEALRNEMHELKRRLGPVYSPTVLCHNDLSPANIIYNDTKGTVKFIDYEYGDFNYQAFDIANLFNEYAGLTDTDYSRYPSVELQMDWLTAYLRRYESCSGTDTIVSEHDVKNLYITVCKFNLASHFFWGLWAVIQARHSDINFDFMRYANARFERYFEMKEEYFDM
ncbi:ethanolamine kinase 1-like [Alosa sapidissima]|uniref:ethanolamine kinase 1-like n=1 Tax=Alosa sapidissima TaxID=34773 RepID=UPI001C099F05|nr:ethanolamine kinase 1-like [Alosa sapidissima]